MELITDLAGHVDKDPEPKRMDLNPLASPPEAEIPNNPRPGPRLRIAGLPPPVEHGEARAVHCRAWPAG